MKRLIVSLLAGVAGVALSSSDTQLPPWILAGDKAYVVMPATPLALGDVRQSYWSTVGTKLVFVTERSLLRSDSSASDLLSRMQQGVRGGTSWQCFYWDRATGKSSVLWKSDSTQTKISDVSWAWNDTRVFINLSRDRVDPRTGAMLYPPQYSLLMINPSNGATVPLPDLGAIEDLAVYPSDRTDRAVIVSYPLEESPTPNPPGVEPQMDYTVVDSQGSFLQHFKAGPRSVRWVGDKFYLEKYDPQTKKMTYWQPNSEGALTQSDVKPEEPAKTNKPLDFSVQQLSRRAQMRKTMHSFDSLWISSVIGGPKADSLIAPGAKFWSLSPKGDALFYVEGGVAKVSKILTVDGEGKKKIIAAEKAALMSRAKQVGLALNMYALDSDDFLPPGDVDNTVAPYVKDSNAFDGFNYTPPSGLKADPNAVLGTFEGIGGTVTVYGDGHVVWQDSNP